MAEKLVPINGRTAWTIRGLELMGSIMAAVLAAYIFLDTRHDSLERRVTAIEANRFTTADGQDLWKAISRLESSLAEIPDPIPPIWFLNRVDGIDARVRALESNP